MSEIKTLKYKKTLRIAGICIICWLYALAFAALASSCSGEDESAGRNMAKTALLRLNVSGTGAASTRATAAALPENESAVHRLAIGLFYADGSVNTIVESAVESGGTAGTLAVKDILCSPGVCDVIVIANVPEGTFAGVQTKNEFVGKNVSLVQTVRNGQQASDLLPMSGISEQPVTLEAGKTVSASINLSPSGGSYLHFEHPQRIQPELCRSHIYAGPYFPVQCAGSFPCVARRCYPNYASQSCVVAWRYDERAARRLFLVD